MMKHVLLSIVFVSVLATPVQAETSSGCGVGWYVTNRVSLLASAIRASTNATFLSPLAMTSGTSGCAKHTLVFNDRRGIELLAASYDSLLVESAQGDGEYVQALGRTLGCDDASLRPFAKVLQENHEQIFAHRPESPSHMFVQIKSLVHADSRLSACTLT